MVCALERDEDEDVQETEAMCIRKGARHRKMPSATKMPSLGSIKVVPTFNNFNYFDVVLEVTFRHQSCHSARKIEACHLNPSRKSHRVVSYAQQANFQPSFSVDFMVNIVDDKSNEDLTLIRFSLIVVRL